MTDRIADARRVIVQLPGRVVAYHPSVGYTIAYWDSSGEVDHIEYVPAEWVTLDTSVIEVGATYNGEVIGDTAFPIGTVLDSLEDGSRYVLGDTNDWYCVTYETRSDTWAGTYIVRLVGEQWN